MRPSMRSLASIRRIRDACLVLIALNLFALGEAQGESAPIEIVPFASHGSAGIKEVSFSGDGTKVLSLDDARILKIWDVSTGRLLRTIRRPKATYVEQNGKQLSVSKNGSRILWSDMAVSEETGGEISQFESLLDLTTGTVIQEYEDSDLKMLPVFSGNGEELTAIASDGHMQTINAATGKVVSSVTGFGQKSFVGTSSDGNGLLFQNGERLEVWDTRTKRVEDTIPISKEKFASASFRSADRLIAVSEQNSNIALWNVLQHGPLSTYMAAPLPAGHELKNHKSFIDDRKALLLFTHYNPENEKNEKDRFGNTLRLWNYKQSEFIELEKANIFIPHYDASAFLFSSDGNMAVGVGRNVGDATSCLINVWNTRTGSIINSISVRDDHMRECLLAIDLSPDSTKIIVGRQRIPDVATIHDSHLLRIWDIRTGALLHDLSIANGGIEAVAFNPGGDQLVSGTYNGFLNLWDTKTAALLRSLKISPNPVQCVAISPNGQQIASGSFRTIQLWDAKNGKSLRQSQLKAKTGSTAGSIIGFTSCTLTFSTDGMRIIWGGELHEEEGQDTSGSALLLWDLATGNLAPLPDVAGGNVEADNVEASFSADGTKAVTARSTFVTVWDTSSWHSIRNIKAKEAIRRLAVSPDGKSLVVLEEGFSGSKWRSFIESWDLKSGKRIAASADPDAAATLTMKFLPEGDSFLTISRNAEVKIWEVKSLKPRQTFTLCDVEGMSVAFSSDMHRVFFGTPEGSIKLCGSQTGPEPLTLVSEPGGWLTMTPAGFFSAAFKGPDLLSVVRGLEVTTIGQVHQSLFNPDLVHEAVSGDPDGEVKRAAEVINLDKVLGSGPAPAVEISSGPSEARSDTDLITVSAHIRDRGKGIGRIEWRVNGITVGVANPPPGAGPDYETKRELALDPGENVIEVVAYNARNLLASPPAQTKIVYTGRGDTVKPKLHVLAIGINAYEDKGWTDPRTSETMLFRPLGLAAADATALAAEMKTAAAGLYSEVRIRTAIDREATAAGLDRIVQDMSREMSARDTFVLFAAAHGYSLNGRFYLIPQDYQGGSNPDALASKAITQETLQDWIANRIKARKALILLDTCESRNTYRRIRPFACGCARFRGSGRAPS